MCRVANLAARSSNLERPQGCILGSGELRSVQMYVGYSTDILGVYWDYVDRSLRHSRGGAVCRNGGIPDGVAREGRGLAAMLAHLHGKPEVWT